MAAFLPRVLFVIYMTNAQTRYAQFNALTVTGRIFNAEMVDYNGSQFLSVTVISTATKDGADICYSFTDKAGLMKLHLDGYFGTGREVTITGHLTNVSEVYTDKKTGEVRMRKRPEVALRGVTVLDGGLGRMPSQENAQRPASGTVISVGTPATDVAPAYGEATETAEDGAPLF